VRRDSGGGGGGADVVAVGDVEEYIGVVFV